MTKSYEKSKGRKSNESYFGIPKQVLEHENFIKLSPYAIKLLTDLGRQYKGFNNGDLCATWIFMREKGWKSKDTLNDSLRELEYYGLIVQTQIGGLNRASLYAFAWRKIDKAEKISGWKVGERPNTWKQGKRSFTRPSKVRRLKKNKARLAGQSSTFHGAVVKKFPNIR